MAKKDKDGKGKKPAPGPGTVSTILTMAARSMRTTLSRHLLETGLYAGQDGVILALAETGGMAPSALAGRLGVKAPTMTRTIARLEVQGFVTRNAEGGDGRMVRVVLTPEGEARVDDIVACIARSEAEALAGLSAKDTRRLVKLLARIDANLSGNAVDDGSDSDED